MKICSDSESSTISCEIREKIKLFLKALTLIIWFFMVISKSVTLFLQCAFNFFVAFVSRFRHVKYDKDSPDECEATENEHADVKAEKCDERSKIPQQKERKNPQYCCANGRPETSYLLKNDNVNISSLRRHFNSPFVVKSLTGLRRLKAITQWKRRK